MTQAGDPTGTGKGGQSIWGKPFPDEIRTTLKVRSVFYIHSPLQSEYSPCVWGIPGVYAEHHPFP